MGVIRDLILEQVERGAAERDQLWLERHVGKEPRLFISSLGGCARKAFFDAYQHVEGHPWNVEKTHPFDLYLLEKFKYGNDWEDVTFQELSRQLPGRVVRNIPLGDEIWAGRADFLVGECFPHLFPSGAVIEHKTTATWNFTYSEEKRRLPYQSHCYQVLAYKAFLDQMTGLDIPAYLYYRSANNMWAEFEGWECGEEIIVDGEIVGHPLDHWCRDRWNRRYVLCDPVRVPTDSVASIEIREPDELTTGTILVAVFGLVFAAFFVIKEALAGSHLLGPWY